MPEISVIVPVYRVEKYINRCVDSILNQTFSDFELILVDDGSPDNCPQICDEYAEKDSRIRVIHKENGGLSSARNAGLDIAAGEWISFIDSDDWVHKDYLLYLYNAAIDSGRLISSTVAFDVHEYINDNYVKYSYHLEKAADSFYVGNDFLSYACAKLYKKELWDSFRFVNGMFMEDLYTIPEVILQEEKIAVLDENLYYYNRANTGSITNSQNKTFKFYNDWCSGYKKNIGLFKKYNDEEHMVDFIKRYFNYNLWTYNDVKSTDDKKFKRITQKRCYSLLRKYTRYFDFKDKDFEWNLCQLSPSFRFVIKIKSLIKKVLPF